VKRLLLISVNYRSAESCISLVESILKAEQCSQIAVRIVDNCSGDDSVRTLQGAFLSFPNAELFVSQSNLGYFGGANFALHRYLEKNRECPDWVIVCNHDVRIEDLAFFAKLLARDGAAVGMIAPSIKAIPRGTEQNPFMRHRPGRWSWSKVRLVSSNYKIAFVWDWLWRQKSRLKSWFAVRRGAPQHSKRRESVYAPHGSFLIFSRRFFECGGFLDGNLFLYGEEISVAEICRELRLPVVFDPSLQVLHAEHHSTGTALSRFTFECQRNSVRYLTSRYFGSIFKDSNTASASVS
jgi:GT2 family glycosyltransferase